MEVVIVERKEQFWGELGASHCNQWGLCDALFSNYFENLFELFFDLRGAALSVSDDLFWPKTGGSGVVVF